MTSPYRTPGRTLDHDYPTMYRDSERAPKPSNRVKFRFRQDAPSTTATVGLYGKVFGASEILQNLRSRGVPASDLRFCLNPDREEYLVAAKIGTSYMCTTIPTCELSHDKYQATISIMRSIYQIKAKYLGYHPPTDRDLEAPLV